MDTIKRVWMITLENDVIGDGFFALEVAQTLREFADSIEGFRAGNVACEHYLSERGTRLTMLAGACEGTPKPTVGPPEPVFPSGRTIAG